MDLSRLPGMSHDDAHRLHEAGVWTVTALAAVDDASDLAGRSGLDENVIWTYVTEARGHIERVFSDAGVTHEADLAAADAHELATSTGLPLHVVEEYQAAARKVLHESLVDVGIETHEHLAAADPHDLHRRTGVPLDHAHRWVEEARAHVHEATREPDTVVEAPEAEPAIEDTVVAIDREIPSGDDRIILADWVNTAAIRINGRDIGGVTIVTGRFPEDATDGLLRAGTTAVFLTEGAVLAPIILDGQLINGFPIYKNLGDREQRVRVKEIRARSRNVPVQGPEAAPAREAEAAPLEQEIAPEAAPSKGNFLSRFRKNK